MYQLYFYLGFSWDDLPTEWNDLLLGADHSHHLLVFGELQLGNPFKTLLQMRLHAEWVFGLGQDLQ